MNKLKKMAMMVVGQSLAPDELAGGWWQFELVTQAAADPAWLLVFCPHLSHLE